MRDSGNKYNIWNKWDKLKTVMLGDCYSPDFFRDIKNKKIRSALQQISEETKEDLEYYESVLKDFGCKVLRPELDNSDSIMNYIEHDGTLQGNQGVPRSPLQPRDTQLVIGDKLFYTGMDHPSIKTALDEYCKNFDFMGEISYLPEHIYNAYKGDSAPDWPSYEEYAYRSHNKIPLSNISEICKELHEIHTFEKKCWLV